MHDTRRAPVVERVGERRPFKLVKKPPRWSHQRELDSFRGQQINIGFADGEGASGELLNSDRFTLQLRLANQSVVTYFKSDMCCYSLVQQPKGA